MLSGSDNDTVFRTVSGSVETVMLREAILSGRRPRCFGLKLRILRVKVFRADEHANTGSLVTDASVIISPPSKSSN